MSQVQCVGIDCPVNYDACQLFPAENKSLTNAHGDALLPARSCSYLVQSQELIEEDHELCFRY